MIDVNDLLGDPELYRKELNRRHKDLSLVDEVLAVYAQYKPLIKDVEVLRAQKNAFNALFPSLSEQERQDKLKDMKELSRGIKQLEEQAAALKDEMEVLIKFIPNVLREGVPTGKSDDENQLVETFGNEPRFEFDPKPYWELEVYKKYVGAVEGTDAMGSRGYYLRGEMARFQKVLFDYAQDIILRSGYELFYTPLMLNERVLTGTGHLPDFDGQQYEVPIDGNKSFYLIGSSEPSIMGYFMDKNLGSLKEPILATCWSSCFRKEAGSYGKDQQGILRVHQFEKVEMVVICRPEDAEKNFAKNAAINEYIWNSLGVYFRKVEICSGDMPSKHFRQHDYDARFPAAQKFREIGSNGNATDFQNRGLQIFYMDDEGGKRIPFGLNDTGMTFRTGLAILEQFQNVDGRVKVPGVLVERFGKEWLE